MLCGISQGIILDSTLFNRFISDLEAEFLNFLEKEMSNSTAVPRYDYWRFLSLTQIIVRKIGPKQKIYSVTTSLWDIEVGHPISRDWLLLALPTGRHWDFHMQLKRQDKPIIVLDWKITWLNMLVSGKQLEGKEFGKVIARN